MLRRRFLSLLGCLPFGLGKAVTHTLPAPHTARDSNGDSVAEAYLLQVDGSYQRVAAKTLKPGDVYLMLGLDGDRLWTVRLLKVGPRGVWLNKKGAYCADIEDLDDELLHKGREYAQRVLALAGSDFRCAVTENTAQEVIVSQTKEEVSCG
jgi:hypothetical protein